MSNTTARIGSQRLRVFKMDSSVAEVEKHARTLRAWQLAHTGFARCWIIASRIVSGLLLFSVLSAGTLGGGGGGGDARIFSITHLPRSTGEVRLA